MADKGPTEEIKERVGEGEPSDTRWVPIEVCHGLCVGRARTVPRRKRVRLLWRGTDEKGAYRCPIGSKG